MPTRGVIETFHETLASETATIIAQSIQITPYPDDWHKVADQSRISWTAFPEGNTPIEWAFREQGSRVPVFPVSEVIDLSDFSHRGWVGWAEKWVKIAPNDYDLMSAGWTAFWGPPYYGRAKVPVLRAEWDQLDYVDGTKDMGQPHWHVDRAIPVSSEVGAATGIATSAGEIAPQFTDEPVARNVPVLHMGQVHLAMAAWERQAHPQCWQRDYGDGCGGVLDWATKTLRYLKSQFDVQRGFVTLADDTPRIY
jgi:hypothetical protein